MIGVGVGAGRYCGVGAGVRAGCAIGIVLVTTTRDGVGIGWSIGVCAKEGSAAAATTKSRLYFIIGKTESG